MSGDELAWTVEQACLNAWPSPRQAMLGDWLVRAAGGPSRRINSVSPLRAPSHDPLAMIEAARAIYAAVGQPLIVRVPALVANLDAPLAALGFEAQAESCTLFASLANGTGEPAGDTELSPVPSEAWLALRSRLNGDDPVADRVIREVIRGVLLPKTFASARTQDGPAAIAFGVIDRGLLVVESVGTEASMRGRGHARRAVAALMSWAHRQGAWGACLQVLAANEPARRLYAALGFGTDLYRYTYRCRERIG